MYDNLYHRFESYTLRKIWVSSNGKTLPHQREKMGCMLKGSIPPTHANTSVAQLVEHWSPKPGVGGSNPSRRAILNWEINSVGSECYPYKVEVVGSNPSFPTNSSLAQLRRALVLHTRGYRFESDGNYKTVLWVRIPFVNGRIDL